MQTKQQKALLPTHFAELTLTKQAEALFVVAPYFKQKIIQHCDLGDCTPEQGLLEVLRFLSLINESVVMTPSDRVDQIWHQFILWTRLYSEYCTTLYQKYLHHTPDDDKSKNSKQFEQTRVRYMQDFGQPNPYFWGPFWSVCLPDACSGCES